MQRIAWWVAAGAVALAGIGLYGMAATRAAPAPDALALYEQALDAYARGHMREAAEPLLDAWQTDPAFITALGEFRLLWDIARPPELRRSLDAVVRARGDPLLERCVHELFADTVTPAAAGGPDPVPDGTPGQRCLRFVRAVHRGGAQPQAWAELARDYPYSLAIIGNDLAQSVAADPVSGLRLARRYARDSEQHPLIRNFGYEYVANALHRLGRHAEAVEWEAEAEAVARAAGPGALFMRLDALADEWRRLPELPDADTLAVHMAEVAERTTAELLALEPQLDAWARLGLLFSLGTRFLDSGRLREADEVLVRLVALADSLDLPVPRARAHARYGRLLVKLGRLDDAERELLTARALAREVGALHELREAAHDLLHLYEARGRLADAVAAGRDFLVHARLSGARQAMMMANHDLGWVYRRQGMLDSAQLAFTAMLAQIDTLGELFHWAGEYYEYAGELERARDYYLRTLTSTERSRSLSGLVRVSEALGDSADAFRYARIADREMAAWFPEYAPLLPSLLARYGNTGEALRLLGRARALASERGNVAGYALLSLELAELLLAQGDERAAGALGDTAAAAARQLGLTERELHGAAIALRTAADDVHARADRLARLAALVRRGDRMGMPQLAATLHTLHADALLLAGQSAAALAAYARAADWVDSTAARLETDPNRAAYRAAQARVTSRALSTVLHAGNAGNAGNGTGGVRDYAAWSARRKGGSPAAAQQVVRRLPDRMAADQAVIDYVVLDTAVAALVVTSDGSSLHVLPASGDTLRARVARLRAPLAPRVGSAVDRARIVFDTATAARLFLDLVAPLSGALGGRRRLVIVGDGPLHLLPFDVLVVEQRADGTVRHLLDDHTVVHAPSLDALEDWFAPVALRRVVVIQDPNSAGSTPETDAIAHALGGAVTVLSSGPQLKLQLRAAARSADVLHFATHAEPNDYNPDYARLALAGDAGPDGWLHAFEIRSWQVRDALIVLSACETAAGRLAGGEGTLSLARAFLHAGAAGTVATLWPVGAPTAALMAEFYAALAAGAPPPDALRAARLALRRTHPHPFYWAPFALTVSGL